MYKDIFCAYKKAVVCFAEEQIGQSIQEWTKQILWKTAFKKFEGMWSA